MMKDRIYYSTRTTHELVLYRQGVGEAWSGVWVGEQELWAVRENGDIR
jgi:hypothetical protein